MAVRPFGPIANGVAGVLAWVLGQDGYLGNTGDAAIARCFFTIAFSPLIPTLTSVFLFDNLLLANSGIL
ncbi:hypothetical protein [Phormidium sp. CCY1219]|uniref:hypothetical protein n=1 Tax=Phormidium sp. CCY1219 TaxID=2886104 RepID=UPI002D1EF0FC|nr:hypothetical protein [Phormidium sp. CCY1219]MEB3828274.1 hypothetical protein [Phormidium sp. CCY1219]